MNAMSENITPPLDQVQEILEAESWKIYTEQLDEFNADRALIDALHPQDAETAALWETAQIVDSVAVPEETDLDAEEQAEQIIAQAGLIAFMIDKDPNTYIRPIEITEEDTGILRTFVQNNPAPQTVPDVLSMYDVATKPNALQNMSAILGKALQDNPYAHRPDPQDPTNPLEG